MSRLKLSSFVLAGLAVTLFLAVVVSSFASGAPDGLESAVLRTACADEPTDQAREACLEELAGEPVHRAAPLPDYEVTWLSGLTGVAAAFLVGAGLTLLVRRRQRTGGAAAP